MFVKPNINRESELFDALRQALEQLPGVELSGGCGGKSGDPDAGIDSILSITVQGKPVLVLVEFKQSGYPRDIHRDASRLSDHFRKRKPETVPLIAAPSISPGSRNLLREQQVGYFDAGGSLYLPLSSSMYLIDREPPRIDRRLRSLYRGRSAQVLHVLLSDPARQWHVNELAEESQVSPYTVHQVFTTLEKQLWIYKHGKGPESVRALSEPGALLNAWSENYSLNQYEFRNYHLWSQSVSSLRLVVAEALENESVTYALTLAAGAELVAPFATAVNRLHLIVPATAKLDTVVQATGMKPVDDGANVTFMVTREQAPLLLRRRVERDWVASDVQLYLDLQHWPSRGKEQAEYLRKERLRF